ncbi:hypothetical protein AAMO2058_001692300 [Amorphochlora amoebiformis]
MGNFLRSIDILLIEVRPLMVFILLARYYIYLAYIHIQLFCENVGRGRLYNVNCAWLCDQRYPLSSSYLKSIAWSGKGNILVFEGNQMITEIPIDLHPDEIYRRICEVSRNHVSSGSMSSGSRPTESFLSSKGFRVQKSASAAGQTRNISGWKWICAWISDWWTSEWWISNSIFDACIAFEERILYAVHGVTGLVGVVVLTVVECGILLCLVMLLCGKTSTFRDSPTYFPKHFQFSRRLSVVSNMDVSVESKCSVPKPTDAQGMGDAGERKETQTCGQQAASTYMGSPDSQGEFSSTKSPGDMQSYVSSPVSFNPTHNPKLSSFQRKLRYSQNKKGKKRRITSLGHRIHDSHIESKNSRQARNSQQSRQCHAKRKRHNSEN